MIHSETEISRLVTAIKSRETAFEVLANRLRTPATLRAFDKHRHESWCRAVAGDALVRLRQLTQQNFTVVETIGLVVVARYICEVSIWLRLFALDQRYGLVYYDQLLDTQERFYRDTLNQLTREAGWLKTLYEKESAAHGEVLATAAREPSDAGVVQSRMNTVSQQIDTEAARRFSIYAEAGKRNGYGFPEPVNEFETLRAHKLVSAVG